MPLTADIAERVSNIVVSDIAPFAQSLVARGFADSIAVTVAARHEPSVTLLQEVLAPRPGPARLLYSDLRTETENAALLNATAAQAQDFDDTGLEGHPSAVLVPVAMAVGQERGATGADLIAAYVAGYETWAELLWREEDSYHAAGLHPTGLLGTIAAAATAGRLYRLTPARMTHALVLAASFASGIVGNFGSMAKALQTGQAAANGVRAARLAASGYQGSPDALEHRHGFLKAFSPKGNVDCDAPVRIGHSWAIETQGLNIKMYPVCYAAHRLVDAALSVREQPDAPNLSDIVSIILNTGVSQAAPLREHRPKTIQAARFSGEFAVAAALLAGRLTSAELQDDFIQQSNIQDLMKRTTFNLTDDRDPIEPLFAPHDSIVITLSNGKTIASRKITRARGHFSNPPKPGEFRAKFLDCVAGHYDLEGGQVLFHELMQLENSETMPDLVA